MRCLSICIIILIGAAWAKAQDYIEKTLDTGQEIAAAHQLLDWLEQLNDNPLQWDQVRLEELQALPFLTPELAQSLILARDQYPQKQKQMLRGLDGMTPEVWQLLNDVIDFSSQKNKGSFSLKGRHRMALQLEKSRGFKEGIYQASYPRTYNRIQGQTAHYEFGFLAEKDPGEQNYADLLSGYVSVPIAKYKSRLMMGNFTAYGGSGLVFAHPYVIGTGFDAMAPAKKELPGLMPYLSTTENAGFRGIGLQSTLNKVDFALFASSSRLDATVENDTIRTFLQTGLHRTIQEKEKKDKAEEQLLGFSANYRFSRTFSAGLSCQSSRFNYPVFPRSSSDNPFAFTGRNNAVAGLNLNFTSSTMHAFCESAISSGRGLAFYGGSMVSWRSFQFLFLVRAFQAAFHNYHATVYSARDDCNNEQGAYLGWQWQATSTILLGCSMDQYRFKWPVYQMPKPNAGGWEWAQYLEWQPVTKLAVAEKITLRQNSTIVHTKDAFENDSSQFADMLKKSIYVQLNYQPDKSIGLRTHVQWNQEGLSSPSQEPDSSGLLLYQQIHLLLLRHLSLYTRWSYFDALNYDTRFFAFENDVPGLLRFKMLYGQGRRWFIVASYPFSNFTVSAKFELTHYENKSFLGSGWDKTDGPNERMVTGQIEWKIK